MIQYIPSIAFGLLGVTIIAFTILILRHTNIPKH